EQPIAGRCRVLEVSGAGPSGDALDAVAEPVPVLPSARLDRLADLTAAELTASANGGGAARPPVLSEQALADVLAAVDASTSVNTKKAYRSDWARFTAWTAGRGFVALPADPLVVAHYLTAAAAEQTGVGKWRYTPATVTRWVSSINQFHTAAGLDAPGRAEVVRRALSGVRRIRATPPVRRSPLLLEDIRTLLTPMELTTGCWPAGVAARRDMAILLMGFAGAHRRSELVALTLADVALHKTDGLHIRLRTNKTDQEARGQVKALPFGRDPRTCPPCAYVRWRQILHAWDTADPDVRRVAALTVLRRQADTHGAAGQEAEPQHCCRSTRIPEPADPDRPVFRSVHKAGAIRATGMTGHAVNEMIKRRAAGAGFSAAQITLLGGHSLRSGFVTEAFQAGADAHAIMRQTGHRSPAMLEVYAREHAPLMGNAVTRIGL
ncbi:MAG: tyrosine-type recombinase/integrase, partial [Nakamurella sp.]